ncbi:hypothetical protein Leryth_027636 [Lithospermum erythrorhizon]|nr:hypothetical protein Leryth_027636 [Lithospermum erythrorhizon]
MRRGAVLNLYSRAAIAPGDEEQKEEDGVDFHGSKAIHHFPKTPSKITMKSRPSRSNSTTLRRSTTPHSFCTFLKPGALAQMRYSKIAAKSRAKYSTTLIALSQMHQISVAETNERDVIGNVAIDEIPRFLTGFRNRHQQPRCLLRKKLVAVLPIFMES